MISKTLRFVDRFFPPKKVYAHCDIPCGIYDPHHAQVAAHTVKRMVNLIEELKASSEDPDFSERKRIISHVARLTKVKEDHVELVKHEVRIIWGDYFKPEHIQKFPKLHNLVFDIMKLASSARQNVDIRAAEDLLSKVQEFAEIFWKSKGLESKMCKSTFPTEGEIVVPKV